MKNNFWQEISISFVLILLLGLFLNPFQMNMSSEIHMVLESVFIVVFSVFAIFIWREQARDEREAYLLLMAERIGYITAAALLVVAIATQYLSHKVDPWLVGTLGAMVLAKVAGLVYGKIKH
jgi:membrane glycosyltransferase